MRGVLTARDVEAAAAAGRREVGVDGMVVTPLARDRATALGIVLRGPDAVSPVAPACRCAGGTAALRLQSQVRMVARQLVLRENGSLGDLEEIVAAVLERLGEHCACQGVAR